VFLAVGMVKNRFRVGLMFSTTGPYSIIADSMLNGALLALEEINRSGGEFNFDPVVVDPGGSLQNYSLHSAELLKSGVRHVIGCYTSSSRKEVIPCFEKYDGLLWYPSHYEGFESSTNVIYTGAAPNQHILPLIDHLVTNFGPHAFCIGSNYIWAWENNRILRETIMAQGGSVLAERYLAIGDTELDQMIDAILDARPSFVFSSLIGVSAYLFFRKFRAACLSRGIDQPNQIPVASCNLSEPELAEIGEDAVDGHLSSSVYFSSLRNNCNKAFVANYAKRFPDRPLTSADAEASYIAAKLLGAAVSTVKTDEVGAVKVAVAGRWFEAPQGHVMIDPATMHSHLTPRIGRSKRGATFDVIMEEKTPIPPDPYLVRSGPRYGAPSSRGHLWVAS